MQHLAHLKQIRVAIIGAGETGTPLLQQLLQAPYVRLVGVADLNPEQPGMVLARTQGVFTTQDFMELARQGEGIDIIIDVTGAPKVRETLRHYMQESNNQHTIIMHELVAVLLMSLFQGRLVTTKHQELDYN